MSDMHLHEIPWPSEVLRDLGKTPVKMRVTLSYYEEMGQGSQGGEGDWFLGDDLRGQGSIHSDWWEGTAIDLAERGHIGICPVIGRIL